MLIAPFLVAGWFLADPARNDEQARDAADRAARFLEREVGRWSREHRCFSCHNNGDAVRALFRSAQARGQSLPESLAATTSWLRQPQKWDANGPGGPFSDKRLARSAFSFALATGVETGMIKDRLAVEQSASGLAKLQAPDGSWPIEGVDDVGSPTTLGRPLIVLLARDALRAADPVRFAQPAIRATTWLDNRPLETVIDAAVSLMAGHSSDDARISRAITILHDGEADEGGWGPRIRSAPEVFDTGLALLGLARARGRSDVDPMIRRGRDYLIAEQQDDGSWVETTRPPGGVSYAQRVSTTAWATMALLATEPSRPAGQDSKR